MDLSSLEQALPQETVSALQGTDFGFDFLNGGSTLSEAINLPSDLINVGTSIITDAGNTIAESVMNSAVNIGSTAMQSANDLSNKALDTANAMMELMNYAVKDMAQQIEQEITEAVNQMLAVPTMSDVTSKMSAYTLALVQVKELVPELTKSLISIKKPSLNNLMGSATKILGEGVNFITDKVGYVNDKVEKALQTYRDTIELIMNGSDQGIEWISEQIGFAQGEVISQIEKILYGCSRPVNKINHLTTLKEEYERKIEEYKQKIEKLKTDDTSNNKKVSVQYKREVRTKTIKYENKISDYETKISDIEDKIEELECYDNKSAYNKRKYLKKIDSYTEKMNESDATDEQISFYQQKIDDLKAKIKAIDDKNSSTAKKIEEIKQNLNDINTTYKNENADFKLEKKAQCLREIIKLECRQTSQKGAVGFVNSIKQRIVSEIALSLAIGSARMVIQAEEAVLNVAQEKVDEALQQIKTDVKSKARQAVIALWLMEQ